MSLKFLTNFNSAPYYDDFDENKKFLKILFNPKLPIQVRELAQIQTILSDQLSRLGDYQLKDASMVIDGNVSVDTNVEYVKLNSLVPIKSSDLNTETSVSVDIKDVSASMEYSLSVTDANGSSLDGVTEGQVVNFILTTKNVPDGTLIPYVIEGISEDDIQEELTGNFVVISNRSVVSITTTADLLNENVETMTMRIDRNSIDISSNPNLSTVNLNSILSNFENRTVRGKISGAEFFVRKVSVNNQTEENTIYGYHITGNVKLLANEEIETLPENGYEDYYALVGSDSNYKGKSSFATINSGIFYLAGMFHIVDRQEIILEKYSDNPKYTIGLELVEKIIDYSDDISLLDNATGTPNKNAPGADRFSVDLILKKEKYDDILDNTVIKNSGCQFYELIRVDGSRRINIVKSFPFSHISQSLSRERKIQGNRLLKPFDLDIDDHSTDESKLLLNLGPGEAIVNGYSVTTSSKQILEIDKAREYGTVNNDYIFFDHGNYFYVTIPISLTSNSSILPPSFREHEELELYDSSGTNKIGSLKFKFLDFGDNDSHGTTYKLHFHDLNMLTDSENSYRYSVSDIFYFRRKDKSENSFEISSKSRDSSSSYSGSIKKTFISEVKHNSLIFDFPDKFIKKVNSFKYLTTDIKILNHTSGINSNEKRTSLSLNNDSSFPKEIQNKNLSSSVTEEFDLINKYFIVMNTNTGEKYDDLDLKIAERDVQITIKNSNLMVTDTLSVICKFFLDVPHRTKTKKTATITVDAYDYDYNHSISLGKVDVIEILSVVVDSSGTDYKNCFTLDNGQTDNSYEISSLTLSDPHCIPDGSTSYVISFSYFEHSPGIGYFSSNSYFSSPDGSSLYDVEEYVSAINGKSFDLLSSIDFRPTFDIETEKIQNFQVPVNSDEISMMSYERYFGRIDKVVIDENRKIEILKGSSEISPKVPEDRPDKLTIYTLSIPPYTKNKNEIDIVKDLCERKNNYLNLLIEKAKNQQISNQLNTGQVFKSGIFVDDFSNHSFGDVNSTEYKCSIDYSKKELRNAFSSSSRKMTFNETDSIQIDPCDKEFTNVLQKGPYVMPKYDEVEFLVNPLISQSVPVNPNRSVSWHGDVKIFPKLERWYDDSVNPEILSNIEGKNNNWETVKINSSNGFGSQWNDWQERWFGKEDLKESPKNIFRSKESFRKRRDVENFISSPNKDVNCKKPENKLREVIPFSKTNQVFFISDNLKPNTLFYSFLDDAAVSAFPASFINVEDSEGFIDNYASGEKIIGQTSNVQATILKISIKDSNKIYIYGKTGGEFLAGETLLGERSGSKTTFLTESVSTSLTSDSLGELCGYFYVPSNIKTGNKTFRLNDVNTHNVSNSSSLSETSYHVQGDIPVSDLKSTRPFEIKRTHMNVDNSLYEDVYSREFLTPFNEGDRLLETFDHLSQSFDVNKTLYKDGIFLSSVDLFFRTKDSNLPITVEIRPMVNGYPSPNRVIPFSRVTLSPDKVKTSETPHFESDDNLNTRFTFDVPLYLPAGQYCIVIVSNGHNYELWSCENGKVVLDETGNICEEQLIVTQQPNIGEMYSSHNSGIHQSVKNQHLSFRLNRCDFSVGSFRVYFDSIMSSPESFNLFNFQTLVLEDFDDISDLQFEYSIDKTNYVKFEKNSNIELLDPLKVNSIDSSSGEFFRVKVSWDSLNSFVSPLIDVESMNLVTVKNLSDSSYITKVVHLEEHQKSKDLRVFLDAYKPYGNVINVYYKIGNSNDSLNFYSKSWNQLDLIRPTGRNSKNVEDYFEMEFGKSNGLDFTQEQYETFDMFSIKLEIKNDGINFETESYLPKIKDLRVISLKDPVIEPLTYELVADREFVNEANEEVVKFTLYTNAPDGTIIPFTLSGIQINDIYPNPNLTGLKGVFNISGNQDSIYIQVVNDFVPETESITCTLDNILPTISKTVPIIDNLPHQEYNIEYVDCTTGQIVDSGVYCNTDNLCFKICTENVPEGTEISFCLEGLPEYNIKIKDDKGQEYQSDFCNGQNLSVQLCVTDMPQETKIPFLITGLPAPS